MTIDTVNLGRIDLNLLVHLDALLTERSVTRAAARVGIGQSAMSHNLARLRDLFSDELLTRGPEGLRLTPRAATLVEPVRTTLARIQTLVSRDEAFDPATAVRTFRLGLPDSMEILIVPALLARLREVAPGIHLWLYSIGSTPLLDTLDADELDLAIGYDVFPQGQTHHKRRRLFTENYLCMFNAERTGIAPPDLARRLCAASSCPDQPEARAQRARRGGRCSGKARPAALSRPDHTTFPRGPVPGGARTCHRNHACATGANVRRRTWAQPQPAAGGAARGNHLVAMARFLRCRSGSRMVASTGGPARRGPVNWIFMGAAAPDDISVQAGGAR